MKTFLSDFKAYPFARTITHIAAYRHFYIQLFTQETCLFVGRRMQFLQAEVCRNFQWHFFKEDPLKNQLLQNKLEEQIPTYKNSKQTALSSVQDIFNDTEVAANVGRHIGVTTIQVMLAFCYSYQTSTAFSSTTYSLNVEVTTYNCNLNKKQERAHQD